jgi:tetratricopeptide (TPR) repeat protein
MLHWALMAHLAADSCSASAARGRLRLEDLRGYALTQFANALRVVGRLQEAQRAMNEAQNHLAAGTGDLSLRSRLLQYLATLQSFERDCKEAVHLAREAGQISEDIGETSSVNQARIIESIAHLYGGDPELAVPPLLRALRHIDPHEDPDLFFAASHNLVSCYIELDNPEEALALYRKSRKLDVFRQRPMILLRVTWQEGLLLRRQGHLEAAAAALLCARNGFAERKLAYEAAVLSQDLIEVYTELGRTEELRQTVLDALPLLEKLKAVPKTLAALQKISSASSTQK